MKSILTLVILLGLAFSMPLIAGASIERYLPIPNGAVPYGINEVLVNGRADLLEEIIPVWMNVSNVDHRLYSYEPYLSVWWNMLFPMPGTHGFFGHLTSDQIYWKSWLDACINGRLRVWGRYNTTIVKSQALFLIDWFALKYTVGTLAPYLDEYFIGVEDKQGLRFAELSENLTSSIVEATNASALLVISNLDWYRNVLRELFASVNLNSKHYVLIRGPEYLDGLSHAELSDFEGVYLYTYKYRNFDEAFDALDQYVANGGNVIIDTGFECPESGSARLPGFFPVNETIRSSLGKEWNFTVSATSFY